MYTPLIPFNRLNGVYGILNYVKHISKKYDNLWQYFLRLLLKSGSDNLKRALF